MTANKTSFINEIQGFVTEKFAEKRAAEVSAKFDNKINYIIFPNKAGRFVPVFLYNDSIPVNAPHYICSKGCGIMN
jgi:hypothetical protein